MAKYKSNRLIASDYLARFIAEKRALGHQEPIKIDTAAWLNLKANMRIYSGITEKVALDIADIFICAKKMEIIYSVQQASL